MIVEICKNCVKRKTCKKATHVENYRLVGCSDFELDTISIDNTDSKKDE